MSKKKPTSEPVLAMRRRYRDEFVAALRDGRKQRSWRIENGRATDRKSTRLNSSHT